MDVIYKITNHKLNLSYIGSKKNWVENKYFGSPKCKKSNPNYILQKIWKEELINNSKNFKTEILESFEIIKHSKLLERELFWQKKLNVVKSKEFINAGYATYKGGGHLSQFERTPEIRNKIRIANKGRINIFKDGKWKFVKPEEIEKFESDGWLRKTRNRKKLTKAQKENVANAVIGRIHIHNNVNEKFVYKHELDTYLQKGFKVGRKERSTETKIKMGLNCKGKIHIHKDDERKMIQKHDLKEYLKLGYKLGRGKMNYKKYKNRKYA